MMCQGKVQHSCSASLHVSVLAVQVQKGLREAQQAERAAQREAHRVVADCKQLEDRAERLLHELRAKVDCACCLPGSAGLLLSTVAAGSGSHTASLPALRRTLRPTACSSALPATSSGRSGVTRLTRQHMSGCE